MLQSGFRRALYVALFVSLAACSSSDPNDDPGPGGGTNLGSFNADLGGALTGAISGQSTFGAVTVQGESAFGVTMSSSTGSLLSLSMYTDRPGTGTYTVADLAQANELIGVEQFIATYTSSGGTFFSGSGAGSVTITSSSSTRVRGTFSLTLANPANQQSATFEGSFDATGAEASN